MSAQHPTALPPTYPGRPRHVVDRWRERGDAETHLVTAWYEAHDAAPIDAVLEDDFADHVQGDRVRYHESTDCLLVRKDIDLVTVLDVEGCEDHDLRRAIREVFDDA